MNGSEMLIVVEQKLKYTSSKDFDVDAVTTNKDVTTKFHTKISRKGFRKNHKKLLSFRKVT